MAVFFEKLLRVNNEFLQNRNGLFRLERGRKNGCSLLSSHDGTSICLDCIALLIPRRGLLDDDSIPPVVTAAIFSCIRSRAKDPDMSSNQF
jgi:hypothetical protein